ncbi:uncharacterized protein LOC124464172 [Hypomesus transpacificus]|uniref:uncharacterized protein LOC124464172 n=1 Tax=Hypomesus transpacificus TaxID=137520 RepID=UPI001F088476|nr:uncharacterized protein LOC124464172 [Hypomesus transpacificus]XP_046872069.1 uncharacterized protein LOC124464172 [Hypomesus transpacificus]XP_046872070.1 uncharacterized protein LOC124464172 [Hypomesus transpacificus]XP_046872072.1 uncharacterized protein LOC124464172 [Hypomesus transpacificus]XP_046872073.1 uncharacterized protein LOC124464172 [Hypomesus transpacificus]
MRNILRFIECLFDSMIYYLTNNNLNTLKEENCPCTGENYKEFYNLQKVFIITGDEVKKIRHYIDRYMHKKDENVLKDVYPLLNKCVEDKHVKSPENQHAYGALLDKFGKMEIFCFFYPREKSPRRKVAHSELQLLHFIHHHIGKRRNLNVLIFTQKSPCFDWEGESVQTIDDYFNSECKENGVKCFKALVYNAKTWKGVSSVILFYEHVYFKSLTSTSNPSRPCISSEDIRSDLESNEFKFTYEIDKKRLAKLFKIKYGPHQKEVANLHNRIIDRIIKELKLHSNLMTYEGYLSIVTPDLMRSAWIEDDPEFFSKYPDNQNIFEVMLNYFCEDLGNKRDRLLKEKKHEMDNEELFNNLKNYINESGIITLCRVP